ncbi:MAG: septum formation initiator family protein [Akkermansiaceae bacterium]|nr:septum formation initiator family protein [Akkermansiaceae bacterium]NNM29485.1 septum formation initiator family protein [Akkermansiaceae bacterium]
MARKRKRKTTRTRGRREGRFLRARTTGIRVVNQFAFVVLVAMGCVAVAVLSIPQVRELHRLEGELREAENIERGVLDTKDRRSRELTALRDDPAYLELIARDRLDLCLEGEHVFRIERER